MRGGMAVFVLATERDPATVEFQALAHHLAVLVSQQRQTQGSSTRPMCGEPMLHHSLHDTSAQQVGRFAVFLREG